MVIPLKLVQILIVSLMLTRCATVHGQNQNADLIAQAKKEGRVTWYTTVSIPESKQFMDMFEKQYPFIKVDLLRSGSGALVNRIVSEYAAKNYVADVLHGMSTRGGFTVLGSGQSKKDLPQRTHRTQNCRGGFQTRPYFAILRLRSGQAFAVRMRS